MHDAIGQTQAGFNRIRQAVAKIGADDKAIHNDGNIVLEFFIQRRGVFDIIDGAVDLDALEALFLQVL